MQRTDLRNVAIIAHVDHGKTTLVDGLLRQSGTFRANEHIAERAMDSNDLERERGITILSKNTAVSYNGGRINIVDTPGHADFSGEVERILGMVDGALLIVDAFEGPMAQTKFVLRKAMESGLKIIVVINKIDRADQRSAEVLDEVLELFIELGATDDQIDFPVIYASGRNQWANTVAEKSENLEPLFNAIVTHVPAPEGDEEGVLQMLVTSLDYDDYTGRIAVGRISQGKIKPGMSVALAKRNGSIERTKVVQLYGYHGLKRVPIESATVGDIVCVTGPEDIHIGETITDYDNPAPLPLIHVDEPTLIMTFQTNTSPFVGREGDFVTSRHLRSRLMKELEKNVALRVDETDSPDIFEVAGRGELHLSILIETMRREGFELAVSKPRVIMQRDEDGHLQEPLEHLIVDVPEEFMGVVMEKLGIRKAEMTNMTNSGNGQLRLEFIVPARGLIGYRSQFLTDTKGYGVMNHLFHGFGPHRGEIEARTRGSIIATDAGSATQYAINALQDRGQFFITPGAEVYVGMVVGEHNREMDLDANVCKQKHLTNMRQSGSDSTVRLDAPRTMSLEEAIEQISDDELLEITPKSFRLRKSILDQNQRDRAAKGKSATR